MRSTDGEEMAPGEGVGARQEGARPPARGGGYPNIYTSFEPPVGGENKNARDLRLDELREMGVGYAWLRVADRIGVDAFLEMWRTLDEERAAAGRREVYIPNFTTYTNYQRNRFIQAMAAAGCDAREIRRRLQAELNESLTVRHILRVVSGGKG